MANFLDWKAAKTVNDIALLSATTSSHRKTYANLTTTVDYLTTKLLLADKNLLAALRDNNRLKRLLGKFRIGGCTSEKTVTGGALPGMYYCLPCGYYYVHPIFKCTDPKMVHVINAKKSEHARRIR